MKKFAFIIPYIGKFPQWFQLWLNSCANNNRIVDWLIFTDDHTPYRYPDNVIVQYCSFNDLRQLFQKNFDFEINLNRPYKFCDFKPAYGEVFADYLRSYLFWGYCDIDLIWGNLSKWISNEQIADFDRISHWGHCTLLRNNPKMSSLYRQRIDGVNYYKNVYTRDKTYGFDEECGFNILSRSYGVKELVIPFFDIKPTLLSYTFDPTFISNTFFSESLHQKIIKVDKSGTYMYGIKEDGSIAVSEFAYVHLQKRKMKLKVDQLSETYLIVPNEFIPYQNLDSDRVQKLVVSDMIAQLKRQGVLWKSRFNVIKGYIR